MGHPFFRNVDWDLVSASSHGGQIPLLHFFPKADSSLHVRTHLPVGGATSKS